jgi:hypothetical protein
MLDTKSILASRTVWANLVGLAALGLSVLGYGPDAIDKTAVTEAVLQMVAAGSFIASTVFRLVATRQLLG